MKGLLTLAASVVFALALAGCATDGAAAGPFSDSFENGVGAWKSDGGAVSVVENKTAATDGTKVLAVSVDVSAEKAVSIYTDKVNPDFDKAVALNADFTNSTDSVVLVKAVITSGEDKAAHETMQIELYPGANSDIAFLLDSKTLKTAKSGEKYNQNLGNAAQVGRVQFTFSAAAPVKGQVLVDNVRVIK